MLDESTAQVNHPKLSFCKQVTNRSASICAGSGGEIRHISFMPPSQAPTIMDVAKAAGVSFSTVSLALRYPLRVRPQTLQKVQEAAAALSYERNPSASSLASRGWQASQGTRASSIAYVTGGPSSGDPFSGRLRVECDRMGYGLEIVHLEQVAERGLLGRNLHARGCVGVVFGPVQKTQMVDDVNWSAFSLVRCNNDTAHLDVHRVESDVFEATWRVTSEAIRRGSRRIGLSLFRHERGFDDDVRRLGAFRTALEETAGVHAKSGPVFSHQGKWEQSRFLKWFKKNPVDALVCFGVSEYYWLLEEGVRVPEDVSIVALNNAGDADNLVVTGCREDYEQIVLAAFRKCEQFIRSREKGFSAPAQVLNLPCLWNEGITLPWK